MASAKVAVSLRHSASASLEEKKGGRTRTTPRRAFCRESARLCVCADVDTVGQDRDGDSTGEG